MAKKAALGRGLSALLPSTAEPDDAAHPGDGPKGRLYSFEDRVRLMGRVADVDVEHVRPNPYQPRKDFDQTTLDELADSIRQLGIIQPITVRALGDGKFELISGERRLRAARRAGLETIPAYVREADVEAMLEMALVENVQRENLNPVEIALGYRRLMEECELRQEDVAKKVGKSRATVANTLRLLKLPPRLQAALRDGTLTIGHARALINVDDEAAQIAFLAQIEEDELSVREVEAMVRAWHRRQEQPEPEPEAPTPAAIDAAALQVRALANDLRSHLSTQVQIRYNPETTSGKIEIAYYSNDDLERLLEIIMKSR